MGKIDDSTGYTRNSGGASHYFLHYFPYLLASNMSELEPPFPAFHYHPHQAEGIQWMMDREDGGVYCNGGILADEMGLGKTWETIGLLLNRPVPYTLLLLPPVLQGQWSDALAQSEIPHTLVLGKTTFKKVRGKRENLHVVIATYDRAARYAAAIKAEYAEFDRIICDEGHVFRNGPRTRRFQEISEIEAGYRWLLTGTPVQNRATDFHNLLKWLGACYDRKLDHLSVIAETVMLRRTVADVREAVPAFPEAKPVHYIHPVMMPEDGDEKRIFDRLVRRFKVAVAGHMESWMILELFLRIRQFLAHPQIYKDAFRKKYPPKEGDSPERHEVAWTGTASKMETFTKFMATSAPEPTLVFTTFKEEMNYTEEACKKAGYTCWRICGGVGSAGIDNAVRKSRAACACAATAGEGNAKVAVLVQIQAGNAGINLQHLSRIVFMSSHWNPAVVDQAVGRSYRIGQSKPVSVHHILLADGAEKNLDRYMAGLHCKKRLIAKEINAKLACDSAVDTTVVLDTLNAVCPPDEPMNEEEETVAEDA